MISDEPAYRPKPRPKRYLQIQESRKSRFKFLLWWQGRKRERTSLVGNKGGSAADKPICARRPYCVLNAQITARGGGISRKITTRRSITARSLKEI